MNLECGPNSEGSPCVAKSCLVQACCQEPCDEYINFVYNNAEKILDKATLASYKKLKKQAVLELIRTAESCWFHIRKDY